MKLLKILVAAFALMASGLALAGPVLGKDYTMLDPAQPTDTKKIEVREFFFYGCSHCYRLHPLLSAWEKTMPKDVETVFVPAVFRDSWEPMARAYYALDSMGKEPQLRDALYKAWNEDNIQLFEEGQVRDFVSAHGVDGAKFSSAYNSFSVQSDVNRAKQMIRSYAIDGTPTLVVDGKYKISGLQPEDTIRALKQVIEMARKEHKK
jgi:protein dithiol oxidoreductase (disulfide-forming)